MAERILVVEDEEPIRKIMVSMRSQELGEHGEVKRATGTWHRVGEGGIEFSKKFLAVAGHHVGTFVVVE